MILTVCLELSLHERNIYMYVSRCLKESLSFFLMFHSNCSVIVKVVAFIRRYEWDVSVILHVDTVKCHYNACHYNANASLTRSILGSQTAPTSWHALMTVPEWLSTWAKGVKSSRFDRPQRQWHLFVPIQLEQNKRIPPAGHVNTVDSWLIFDQTHWLFISDALRMPPFGQYGC